MDEKTIKIAYLLYTALLLESAAERIGMPICAIGRFTPADLLAENDESIDRRTHQLLCFLACFREPEDYKTFKENMLEAASL